MRLTKTGASSERSAPGIRRPCRTPNLMNGYYVHCGSDRRPIQLTDVTCHRAANCRPASPSHAAGTGAIGEGASRARFVQSPRGSCSARLAWGARRALVRSGLRNRARLVQVAALLLSLGGYTPPAPALALSASAPPAPASPASLAASVTGAAASSPASGAAKLSIGTGRYRSSFTFERSALTTSEHAATDKVSKMPIGANAFLFMFSPGDQIKT
jgi:hypothetical protein